MTNKETKLSEMRAQIEALETMPEGTRLSRDDSRVMLEKRRARYVAEAKKSLEYVSRMEEKHFTRGFMEKDVIFDYVD